MSLCDETIDEISKKLNSALFSADMLLEENQHIDGLTLKSKLHQRTPILINLNHARNVVLPPTAPQLDGGENNDTCVLNERAKIVQSGTDDSRITISTDTTDATLKAVCAGMSCVGSLLGSDAPSAAALGEPKATVSETGAARLAEPKRKTVLQSNLPRFAGQKMEDTSPKIVRKQKPKQKSKLQGQATLPAGSYPMLPSGSSLSPMRAQMQQDSWSAAVAEAFSQQAGRHFFGDRMAPLPREPFTGASEGRPLPYDTKMRMQGEGDVAQLGAMQGVKNMAMFAGGSPMFGHPGMPWDSVPHQANQTR